jgi:hypothetical protein
MHTPGRSEVWDRMCAPTGRGGGSISGVLAIALAAAASGKGSLLEGMGRCTRAAFHLLHQARSRHPRQLRDQAPGEQRRRTAAYGCIRPVPRSSTRWSNAAGWPTPPSSSPVPRARAADPTCRMSHDLGSDRSVALASPAARPHTIARAARRWQNAWLPPRPGTTPWPCRRTPAAPTWDLNRRRCRHPPGRTSRHP